MKWKLWGKNEITISAEIWKFNICHYNDAYLLVKGDINIIGHQITQERFKKHALFVKCTTKLDGTTKDNVKDLNLVMPMCCTYNNIVQIVLKQQEVFGFILKIK